jgi:hypothetical protein
LGRFEVMGLMCAESTSPLSGRTAPGCRTLVGMSSFDESKHPRRRGKFTAVSHPEPEVAVGAGFDARYWGLPQWRPGAWVFGSTSCAEIVSGSVVEGPLSRGVASRASLESFQRWQASAAELGTTEGDDFAAGLEDGLRALTGSITDESTAEMLDVAGSQPTSSAARTNWMLGLRAAPTKARYRGQLAAGVILSGADEWWGSPEIRPCGQRPTRHSAHAAPGPPPAKEPATALLG